MIYPEQIYLLKRDYVLWGDPFRRLHDRLEFETYMEIVFEYCHYFGCLGTFES